jgi:hypothetical protein
MNRWTTCAVVALLVVSVAGSRAAAQNLLANPGFEDPITMDGPPFVGFWEGFAGPPQSSATNSSVSPRSGTMHLDLTITNTNETFTGVFQDVPNMVPGTPVTFSGFHRTPSSPFDVGTEIRIEWRNSVTNAEITRTPNLTTVPPAAYTEFVLPSVVPAGADTARVVYAIQSFGPGDTNTGSAFVDDVSFVVIPEPSMAIVGVAGAALLGLRRRSRG